MLSIFQRKPKTCIGIDIGTSSIKVVQLKRSENRYRLETYGELQTHGYLERLNDPLQTKSLKILEAHVVEMVKELLKETEATTKNVVMSIPVFSSFVSVTDLPPMSEKELPRALIFEAKRHIPIPLSEVRIDWKVIGKTMVDSKGGKKGLTKFRVILIAVPKEVIAKYLRIVKALELKLLALELESFSYIRSLVGRDPSTICILDFGARSTSFTVVDKGFIQMSHSLDIAGSELTKALAHGMGIDFRRAEAYKRESGLSAGGLGAEKELRDILLTFVDKIVLELERMIDSYQRKTKRKVTKLILSGGSGGLVGLEEHLKKRLELNIEVANPWARVVRLSLLDPILKELAPRFAVAAGAAMREL